MTQILNAAEDNLEVHAIINLMASTGLRISDAVLLRSDQIENGVLNLRTRKTSTQVEQVLRPEVYGELKAIIPGPDGRACLRGDRCDLKRRPMCGAVESRPSTKRLGSRERFTRSAITALSRY